MTQNEKELLDQLLEKTKRRTIAWEPTAIKDEFVATFRGKFSFTIRRTSNPDLEAWDYRITMRDQENREMFTLYDSTPDLARFLPELFEEARRTALKVDEALAEVLEDLKRSA